MLEEEQEVNIKTKPKFVIQTDMGTDRALLENIQ